MIVKEVEPEKPTPLPLDDPEPVDEKASDSSGTPEFKWGTGGASAKLPEPEEAKVKEPENHEEFTPYHESTQVQQQIRGRSNAVRPQEPVMLEEAKEE